MGKWSKQKSSSELEDTKRLSNPTFRGGFLSTIRIAYDVWCCKSLL